jgi:hypothetical protein
MLSSVKHDLDRARSEAGLLWDHVVRTMTMTIIVADTGWHHLVVVDDALSVAHAYTEEDKGDFEARSSMNLCSARC